jgi:hypothetical protein
MKTGYCTFPLCRGIEEREGFCFHHAKQFAGPKPLKGKKPLKKESEKHKRDRLLSGPKKDALESWFVDRSKEMTGCCVECGKPSTKGNAKYWKFSICHILPKSIFKSVATHPLNFIELCYFENSHHTNFDNNGFEWAKDNMPKAWAKIIARFKLIYPAIEEKGKIPEVLLAELDASVLI